ncbi:binding--dependent transport system inner membrane component family protein [[Clostridium] bifermentans ATCC 638]|uniref:Binding--dependent transport system inner membrane component family protein n=1 Tax=Paraclostridium bifermentans ATCC 638 = DSM 14991 TaxID=1233171 RepID=T4VMZ8_PARBF|nr:ABC transporter permease [Paraclostridium bifermentans]EQK42116.1 binding--dependent transport system inner membrane component family protein [[Clostridium] bifermentans ATCC 638] [Paraclostridium bifermentans ATCC 638 = DSM 14991]RIZ58873.1 ABC transporter permease [Paraclostridium bifermentans]UAG18981.1 ABC transporter permease [Paraclostridium bifermentans]
MEQLQCIKEKTHSNSKINIGIREKTILSILIFSCFLIGIIVFGSFITQKQIAIDLTQKNISPNLNYLFGTDWMGRDMFYRTIKGLSLSMKIGVMASMISGLIALTLGLMSATMGKTVDSIITWIIDLFLSVPHALVIILISISLGGGLKGIIIGVAITHWPSLTRIIRAEVMQIKNSEYVKLSKNFGKSNVYIATKHILPHVIPQLLVGVVLIFPHAILHEASITFLGFGLQPHEPAIGIILSEAMKYLSSGRWWLAFFPGISLVLVSLMVDNIGKQISKFINPKLAHK